MRSALHAPVQAPALARVIAIRSGARAAPGSARLSQAPRRSPPAPRHFRGTVCAAESATAAPTMGSEWVQKEITLPAYKRGCHVVTRKLLELLPELGQFEVGMANFFIQHTSASLTINENASPDVPLDLNDELDRMVPENTRFRHLDEGLDDMPAHVKSSLMGPSLTVPVRYGRLAFGTWQGIYLCEHRNYGGPRTVVVTIQGKLRADGKSYGKYT